MKFFNISGWVLIGLCGLVLAGCGGSDLSISSGNVEPPPPRTVIDAVAISSNPTPAELKKAREAYREGKIIEVDGGGIDRINGLFGIRIEHAHAAEVPVPLTSSRA